MDPPPFGRNSSSIVTHKDPVGESIWLLGTVVRARRKLPDEESKESTNTRGSSSGKGSAKGKSGKKGKGKDKAKDKEKKSGKSGRPKTASRRRDEDK